jgi:uncharacterized membrane protein YagU involved in acid resistance
MTRLIVAATSLVLSAIVVCVLVWTPAGQSAENTGLTAAQHVSDCFTGSAFLALASEWNILFAAMIVFVIAALSKKTKEGFGAAAGIVSVNAVSFLLKDFLLTRPELSDSYGPMHNSLPSGHMTFFASIALGSFLISGRRFAVLTGSLGLIVTAAVSAEVLGRGWHRGSDVMVSVLLSCAIVPMCVDAASRRFRSAGPRAPELLIRCVIGGSAVLFSLVSILCAPGNLPAVIGALLVITTTLGMILPPSEPRTSLSDPIEVPPCPR